MGVVNNEMGAGDMFSVCNYLFMDFMGDMEMSKETENKAGVNIEDLKSIATARCIDIFKDFDESEAREKPRSVYEAWKIGKEIVDRNKMIDESLKEAFDEPKINPE